MLCLAVFLTARACIPLLRPAVYNISDRVILDKYRLPEKHTDCAHELFRWTVAVNLICPLGPIGISLSHLISTFIQKH